MGNYEPTQKITGNYEPTQKITGKVDTPQLNDFPSRQAAIDDAKKHYRATFGNEIKFPDGDDGSPLHGTQGKVAAWGFRVVDPLDNLLAQYVVYGKGKVFTWNEGEKSV